MSVQSHEVHNVAYLSATHDLVSGDGGWVCGDITPGFFPYQPHTPRTQPSLLEGRRESYQQDRGQRSNRCVPETAGGKGRVDGWATSEKEEKQENGVKEGKKGGDVYTS